MDARQFTRRVLSVAVMAAFGTPLVANAGDGFYLGLEGGINFVERQTFKIYNDTGLRVLEDGTVIAKDRLKDGYVAGLVMGYSSPGGLRPELELDYRRNDLKNVGQGGGNGGIVVDGDIVDGHEAAETAMANLWLDFFKSGSVHPYIGAGAGAARLNVRNASYNNIDLRNDESDVVFAYQGGAGVGFDLGDHVTLSLDYRYLRTQRGEFNFINDQPTTRVKARYEAQSAMLGLRYSFGEPEAPPPPPAPPPEPTPPVVEVVPPPPPPPPVCEFPATPGTPMTLEGCKIGDVIVLRGVNFDFDKDSLTSNAKTLLDTVKDALTARPDIKVEVDGYTDAKGSDSYNQALSVRRSASVRKYLISGGIEAGRMTTRGLGETNPIADNGTDEGRELNRRVELHITESRSDLPAPIVESPVPAQ